MQTALLFGMLVASLLLSPSLFAASPLAEPSHSRTANGSAAIAVLPSLPTAPSAPRTVRTTPYQLYRLTRTAPAASGLTPSVPSAPNAITAVPRPRSAPNLDLTGAGEEPLIAVSPEPLPVCPPEAPIRIDATLCLNQTALTLIEAGGELTVNPDGTAELGYDYLGGGFAYDAQTDPCDPNIRVSLQQAAVAGSQVTRGMVDTQLSYPQTDPLIAVNNPQPDGYGGSCTIEFVTFDIDQILGIDDLLQSLDDILGIIDAIASFDVNSLFGVACKVFNNILGDVQERLIRTVQDNNPLTPLQRFLEELIPGFVTPLQSFLDIASDVRPTTATIPGVATGSPLLVSYLPEVGYVYLIQMASGTAMVIHVSPTPLTPTDAV